jgi:N-acetylneuraminate synthase
MGSHRIFDDLFVLEMTNNHLGRLQRALEIVRQHAQVVRANNVRAAIKVQFRDVDSFIHEKFKTRTDIRYVRRITETRMARRDYAVLIDAIRDVGCIPMATPFDEASVDWCVDFDLPIIKVASADTTDWKLLKKIATTSKPVIVSVGGATQNEIDEMVAFFEARQIPLAINHCVAAYPHEAGECELNQIDYLRRRYPNHTIGFSTHEHDDWVHSMTMSYAKGARTFERHIDIDTDGMQIAQYSSLPHEMDSWYKAFHTAKRYCGVSPARRVQPLPREVEFLGTYLRGAYARRDLPAGHVLTDDDIQLAIPLLKGQMSCREFVGGEVLLEGCAKGDAIGIHTVESSYANECDRRAAISQRGLDTSAKSEERSTVIQWRIPRPDKSPVNTNRIATEKVKLCG